MLASLTVSKKKTAVNSDTVALPNQLFKDGHFFTVFAQKSCVFQEYIVNYFVVGKVGKSDRKSEPILSLAPAVGVGRREEVPSQGGS